MLDKACLLNAAAPLRSDLVSEVNIFGPVTVTYPGGDNTRKHRSMCMLTWILATQHAVAIATKLTMHHISTCDQCGRPQKGHRGSWCELPPNCTAFDFDDSHVEGPTLLALGCDKLPSCGKATSLDGGKVAVTYCLKGGYSLYAATDPSVSPPSNCPAPAPPPSMLPPIWHLPARCEEGDVNALFQVCVACVKHFVCMPPLKQIPLSSFKLHIYYARAWLDSHARTLLHVFIYFLSSTCP